MSTFWVESTSTKEDGKVVLWEKHPGHPDGEAYIANDGIKVEVEETPAIKKLLAEGTIKKVSNWDRPVTSASAKTVVATDEDEDEVIARVEVEPASKPVTNGGINRGGRPPRRGQ